MEDPTTVFIGTAVCILAFILTIVFLQLFIKRRVKEFVKKEGFKKRLGKICYAITNNTWDIYIGTGRGQYITCKTRTTLHRFTIKTDLAGSRIEDESDDKALAAFIETKKLFLNEYLLSIVSKNDTIQYESYYEQKINSENLEIFFEEVKAFHQELHKALDK